MTDKKYPSNLTDEAWEVIKAILLKEEGRSMGRPRSLSDLISNILILLVF